MAQFKDRAGSNWTIAIDAPTIRDIRSECQIDLAALDGKTFEKLADDPVLLVDVLWVLCREQAKTLSITSEQFGRLLVGDAIEAATDAMLAGIADFFPQRKSQLVTAMAAKASEIRGKGLELALSRINDPALSASLVNAMQANMDAEINATLTRLSSATNSPASSASVPAA
jgi:hypothetical protein